MKRVRVLGLTLILLSVGAVSLMAAPAKKPAAAKKTVAAAAVNDSDVVLARVGNEVITRRTIAERRTSSLVEVAASPTIKLGGLSARRGKN